ncbi:UNKNOWN [Stylonychia lemnae]|uniref:Uncharacterized protein n=1 Tax=Stylonychia lemnae TaxID=5949 RepID=A0A078AJA0_STYLE|nr:UNKNOWN [Stylonychia lemnae]|eukprot:CDW81572.1 UNKNOWN [Stylonychia lemnae]
MESIIGSDYDIPSRDINQFTNPHRQCIDQISYLQQIQRKVQAELDLVPMPEYNYNRVKHGDEDDSYNHVKTIKTAKSMLEEDIFLNNQYVPNAGYGYGSAANILSSDNTFRRASDTESLDHMRSDSSSINQREEMPHNINSHSSMREVDFQLTQTQGSRLPRNLNNQDQTLQGRKKSVSFKQNPGDGFISGQGVITRDDIPTIANGIIQEKLHSIKDQLQDIYHKNQRVQQDIEEGYSCDNIKIMELVLENILLHWDDIMNLLIDDIIEEEVVELNKIEDLKSGRTERRNKRRNKDNGVYEYYQTQEDTRYLPEDIQFEKRDYSQVDLQDIFKVFDDYKQIETSIQRRL